MKFLIAIVFLLAGFGSCSKVQAMTVPAAMNVSGQGSDYIFVYRGNNPNEFDALVAQGLGNLAGWSATCTSSQCLGTTYTIDHATQPSSDYLYLYTANADGTTAFPDSGRWYSFASPPPPPAPLCCGASAGAVIVPDTNFYNSVNTFTNRTTNDAQIYVEQIGSNNTIVIEQTGTVNNRIRYDGNGNNNSISTTQNSTNSSAYNFIDLGINGNANAVNITQQSTGGVKGVLGRISDNNNSLIVQQKDSGNHYAEVNLSGGNKNVDILQEGSASHAARIGLTGMPVDLSLSQSGNGSANQSYTIQFNCATTGGCPKITVQQGR
jgi:hypothetical protein